METAFQSVQIQYDKAISLLLSNINNEGFWEGKLSSSALGVAVAITALHFHDSNENATEINSGLDWLEKNINNDFGFGDSPKSKSNVSTSLLCYAAVKLCSEEKLESKLLAKIEAYLNTQNICINSGNFVQSILDFYKTDRTFSVPILTMCALCKVTDKDIFESIPQLPFELSLLPRSFYKILNLSVVSYAIPALIAVGIAIFKFKKRKNPILKFIRSTLVNRSLSLLQKIQPESGGYLEAIPLTAFVCLCLTESGYKGSEIVKNGISFLKRTQRTDGSWPIDINLSSWVSSLAVKSLRSNLDNKLDLKSRDLLTNHFLAIQNKHVHKFNGTLAGGWGWTSHSGSVPDGDDTPGVIIALIALNKTNPEKILSPVLDACNWLIKLQNNDGGIPTFSRGWGKLPFDRSCSDLTGHFVLALAKTLHTFDSSLKKKTKTALNKALLKAIVYLSRNQDSEGFWLPLWFGNQNTKDHANPVYGTARVCSYLNDTLNTGFGQKYNLILKLMIKKACGFLISEQNTDSSWGGEKNTVGSIEETSLAISALISNGYTKECLSAFEWLTNKTNSEGFVSAPIGLYFASLWYNEELYPITAMTESLTLFLETSRVLQSKD